MSDILLILAAAFVGGALNALAGGGSFLTLPALIAIGIPPVAANATGTLALLPGYLASAWGFRRDLQKTDKPDMRLLLALGALGGGLGALLLVNTSDSIFSNLVPWLLLVATALFALGPSLLKVAGGRKPGAVITALGIFLACLYGGYFNGGLGILLLALFALLGMQNLNLMNGLKNLLSFELTLMAVAVYIWGGAIFWREALVMMLSATAGGYAGARLSYWIKPAHLRLFIVAVGLVMAGLFFWY